MSYESFETLRVRVERGVAFVTIDHPPINLFDLPLILEMDRLGKELEGDDAVRVVVIESADPEFFIAHADVELIDRLPRDGARPEAPSLFQAMVDRFRTLPKATLGKVAGIARGGGSELLLSLDMRFGARGKAVLSQPEVALGIIPGGSGTQRLPRLVGRGRALEIILGCDDFDAETAERYGWLNRVLEPDALDAFVEALAFRIASFPAAAIRLAKQAVAAAEPTVLEGLVEEAHAFSQALADPEASRRMKRFLESGGQTRELESRTGALAALFEGLADS